MSLRKFVIERDLPQIGSASRDQLRAATAKSNGVLRELGPDIQWVESYVADDKIYCVYLAANEGMIRRHAEMSRFPGVESQRNPQDDRSNNRAPGIGRLVRFRQGGCGPAHRPLSHSAAACRVRR